MQYFSKQYTSPNKITYFDTDLYPSIAFESKPQIHAQLDNLCKQLLVDKTKKADTTLRLYITKAFFERDTKVPKCNLMGLELVYYYIEKSDLCQIIHLPIALLSSNQTSIVQQFQTVEIMEQINLFEQWCQNIYEYVPARFQLDLQPLPPTYCSRLQNGSVLPSQYMFLVSCFIILESILGSHFPDIILERTVQEDVEMEVVEPPVDTTPYVYYISKTEPSHNLRTAVGIDINTTFINKVQPTQQVQSIWINVEDIKPSELPAILIRHLQPNGNLFVHYPNKKDVKMPTDILSCFDEIIKFEDVNVTLLTKHQNTNTCLQQDHDEMKEEKQTEPSVFNRYGNVASTQPNMCWFAAVVQMLYRNPQLRRFGELAYQYSSKDRVYRPLPHPHSLYSRETLEAESELVKRKLREAQALDPTVVFDTTSNTSEFLSYIIDDEHILNEQLIHHDEFIPLFYELFSQVQVNKFIQACWKSTSHQMSKLTHVVYVPPTCTNHTFQQLIDQNMNQLMVVEHSRLYNKDLQSMQTHLLNVSTREMREMCDQQPNLPFGYILQSTSITNDPGVLIFTIEYPGSEFGEAFSVDTVRQRIKNVKFQTSQTITLFNKPTVSYQLQGVIMATNPLTAGAHFVYYHIENNACTLYDNTQTRPTSVPNFLNSDVFNKTQTRAPMVLLYRKNQV